MQMHDDAHHRRRPTDDVACDVLNYTCMHACMQDPKPQASTLSAANIDCAFVRSDLLRMMLRMASNAVCACDATTASPNNQTGWRSVDPTHARALSHVYALFICVCLSALSLCVCACVCARVCMCVYNVHHPQAGGEKQQQQQQPEEEEHEE
uniref:Uncharacterized protein n=1 Tax=Lotharella oceanica TaxID=641309 RepID=A0A7S2X762_9EUKA|mmetsp:Transcript_14538/g.27563  ORF Transcript_14538/g.27563 Transcript_14538/m.27563 type:complete len:152 (+) Transcript_14538:58-513(+)